MKRRFVKKYHLVDKLYPTGTGFTYCKKRVQELECWGYAVTRVETILVIGELAYSTQCVHCRVGEH